VLTTLSLLFCTDSYALSYLKNDFRDTNNTFNFKASLDAKSDALAFDIFEQEWQKVPAHKKNNRALGNNYYEAYLELGSLNIGVFKQEQMQISMSDGFIDTWYASSKDFLSLLLNKNIYQDINPASLQSSANHYKSYGLFIQKIFTLNSRHHLSLKLKLHNANELNHIKVEGTTDTEKFQGSFDYYYSGENLISNAPNRSDSSKGIGYGVDIEYIYANEVIYLYAGVFNLASKIYWENVSLMHYDFDSEVIYMGSDGYNHYRPFGTGKYEYNMEFTQKLPEYYRATLDYALSEELSLGDNLDIYDGVTYNEIYANARVYGGRYKLGYIVENQNLIFGAYYKYLSLEISNSFGSSNDILQANCTISF
jgi:hypothetical protein